MLSPSEGQRRRRKDPDREKDGERERERERARDKDKDRERDPEKKVRHKSSRTGEHRKVRSKPSSTSTLSTGERDGELRISKERVRSSSSKERIRTSSSSTTTATKNRMAVVPELERRSSLGMGSRNGSRSSLSYPTLSKTHAKENIYARDEAGKAPFTPDATDVGDEAKEREAPATHDTHPALHHPKAPPSPPLTATTAADLRKTASANSMRRKTEADTDGRRSADSTRITRDSRFASSRSSLREEDFDDATDLTSRTGSSHPSTVKADKTRKIKVSSRSGRTSTEHGTRSPRRVSSRQSSHVTQSTESDATTRAPEPTTTRRHHREPSPSNSEISPASVVDSSPLTPTQHSILPEALSAHKVRPPTVEIFAEPTSRTQSTQPEYLNPSADTGPLPPPPPPPPPPMIVLDAPRVDYLLLNGGLPHPIVRNPLEAISTSSPAAYSSYTSPRPGATTLAEHNARLLFQPLQKVLDNYNAVMDKNGSLAVATGYRSVARRLLDRLEAVFARNISSEHCTCLMCLEHPLPHHDSAGVNWGEILELVSGRCDLPPWPPLEQATANALGISLERMATPCQKIDVDVPEEYRAHYARQSAKTKIAVQNWLDDQQCDVPEEADEETLTFAMLTRLEPEKRSLFHALMHGLEYLPSEKSMTTLPAATPAVIAKAGLALQRLYRLASPPRSPLVVLYLIRNMEMHNILATLAAVTKHEWEILVSGRFDGFLWSGAEAPTPGLGGMASPAPQANPGARPRGASLNNSSAPGTQGPSASTADIFPPNANDPSNPRRFASPAPGMPFSPFSPPQSTTPFPRPGSTRPGTAMGMSGPAPVQVDEETEIAILAEVEREIHASMDQLENAFESLHIQAEACRERLRHRSAALLMAAQARRGVGAGGIEVRMGTPASGVGGEGGYGGLGVDDWAGADLRSEVGPDDSASNVSHNRRRAHRRRHEGKMSSRTPGPVMEDVEEEGRHASLAEKIRRRF